MFFRDLFLSSNLGFTSNIDPRGSIFTELRKSIFIYKFLVQFKTGSYNHKGLCAI